MKKQRTIYVLSELEDYCHYKSLETIQKSSLIKYLDKKDEKDIEGAEALGKLSAYLDLEEKISYKICKMR